MKEKYLGLGDNNVFYREFGENFSDVILILHGWGGKSDSWIEVGKILESHDYRVIIPDLPGFGKTKLNKTFTIDDYSDLINDFIIKLDIKNFILWGHSNGGAISINYVTNKKNSVSRLILNNSAGVRNDRKRSFKRLIFNNLAKILKPFLKFKLVSKSRNIFYKAIGSHDYIESEKNPFLKETYKNMIGSDLTSIFSQIDIDTLLIRGENDTYTPVLDAGTFRKNIKKSKLVVLENEKHGIHLTSPEKLVNTFLDNI